MISSNESQVTLKLDNWRKRTPDRGSRGLPDEPLTEKEIEYLAHVLYEKSFKAYKGRIVNSDLLSDFEEESDTVGEAYIFMRNILGKFDKAVYKGKITPFVILKKVGINRAFSEFSKNKKKAPKYVLKEIDEALKSIEIANAKPSKLLKYLQDNKKQILETFSFVKDSKGSFSKDESPFFLSFWSELEKNNKDWDDKKFIKIVTSRRISAKETFDKVNRDIKDRYRKEKNLKDKSAVAVDKYPEEDRIKYDFALEFKKTIKNLSFDEFDQTEQKKIFCYQNKYILPKKYLNIVSKLEKENKKYKDLVKDYKERNQLGLSKIMSKLTFKALDTLFQQINVGYFDRELLTEEVLEKIDNYIDSQHKKREDAVDHFFGMIINNMLLGNVSLKEDGNFTKTQINKINKEIDAFHQEKSELSKNENDNSRKVLKKYKKSLTNLFNEFFEDMAVLIDPSDLENEANLIFDSLYFNNTSDKFKMSLNEEYKDRLGQLSRAKLYLQKPEVFDKTIDEVWEMNGSELTEDGFVLNGERLLSYDDQGSNQAKSLAWFVLVYIQNRVNFVACETRTHKELVGSGPSESIIDVAFNPSSEGTGSVFDEEYEISGFLKAEISKREPILQRFFFQKYELQVTEKELREEYPDHYAHLKKETKKLILNVSKQYKNDWVHQTNHKQEIEPSDTKRKRKEPYMKTYKNIGASTGVSKGKTSHLVNKSSLEVAPDFTVEVKLSTRKKSRLVNGEKESYQAPIEGKYDLLVIHPNTREIIFSKTKVEASSFDEAQKLGKEFKEENCPTVVSSIMRTDERNIFMIYLKNEKTQEILFKKEIKARNLLEAKDLAEEYKDKKFKNITTHWQKAKFIPQAKKNKMKTGDISDSFDLDE